MKDYFEEFYQFATGKTELSPPPSQQGDLDWFDSFTKPQEQTPKQPKRKKEAGPDFSRFTGVLEQGNIDLANRPIVNNPDGSISTVNSMSFQDEEGGPEILIPTTAEDGSRLLTPDEAIEQYRKSGKFLGKFKTPEDATKYSLELHEAQEDFYRQDEETEVTPEGLDRLVKDEGERLKVYKDTKGIDTIGVGFNLQEKANQKVFQEVTGFSVEEARKGRQITPEQSRELLRRTVANAEKEAAILVEPFDKLKPEQQDAITNFVFNVGFRTASEFKNTLAAINRGDGKAAADNIRKSRYYKQVGARGERVAKVLETIGGS